MVCFSEKSDCEGVMESDPSQRWEWEVSYSCSAQNRGHRSGYSLLLPISWEILRMEGAGFAAGGGGAARPADYAEMVCDA
jgi:hypothetical protein